MEGILSYFTFKAALWMVAVLMLYVGYCKVYDLLDEGGKNKIFTLKMGKRWMQCTSRMAFWGGFGIVLLAVANFVVKLKISAWWANVVAFAMYAVIGYVAEFLILACSITIVSAIWWVGLELVDGIKKLLK